MMTSFLFGFGLVFVVIGLLACLVVGGIYLLAQDVRRDYRQQGGAKKVVPKIVFRVACRYAAMALRKRLFGF